jgi:yecA family protein
MMHDVNYADILDALNLSGMPGSAAEMHGLLSGMLCMDTSVNRQQWLEHCFDAEMDDLEGEALANLERLFDQTRRQLFDFDFSFEPLLPADDHSLAGRAHALSEWCHGFLQGIGYQGANSRWPGECAEILGDLLEIVQLETVASSEADEVAYAELTEYVRVGVQVIHSELRSQEPRQLH